MARRSAKLLRDKTPNLREEPQVYYVVDKHMCFVCYRLADMPTPRVAAWSAAMRWLWRADLGIKEIAYRTAQNLYSLHGSRQFTR
ncbi:MAG: hypothetical protein WA704_28115, partial [Pseudolabrys sp.]